MLKRITSLLGGFFGGAGPRKIKVTPAKSPSWKNLEASLKKSGELKSLGFDLIGYFTIPELPLITSLAGYVNAKDSCYAVVFETDQSGVVLNIICEYADGREYCYTTAPKPATPQPLEYRTTAHITDSETRAVFQKLMADRPAGALKPVSADAFTRDYEESHAKQFGFQYKPPPVPGATGANQATRAPSPPHALEGSTVEVIQFAPAAEGDLEPSTPCAFCLDLMITPQPDMAEVEWDARKLTLVKSAASGGQEEPCKVTAVQIHDGQNFLDDVSNLRGARYVRMFVIMLPEAAFFRVRYNAKQLLDIDLSAAPEQSTAGS